MSIGTGRVDLHRTYTAQEILDQARIDALRRASFDELFPQFESLLRKLIAARDAGPTGDPVSLTPAEAMLAYRLMMEPR